MLFNSYSYEILYEQFHWIYLQGDIKLLLVNVNNRLKFEIEIVHDLSCHPIYNEYKDIVDELVIDGVSIQQAEIKAEMAMHRQYARPFLLSISTCIRPAGGLKAQSTATIRSCRALVPARPRSSNCP